MNPQPGINIRPESLNDHAGTEIGPADADVDHVGDGFAGAAFPASRTHRLGEAAHHAEHPVHVRHHVVPVEQDWPVGTVAQGHVQDGPVLGHVDPRPPEHGFDLDRQLGLLGELLEEAHGFFGDAILREVEKNIVERQGKTLETLRIRGKQIPHVNARHFLTVLFQRSPGRQLGRLCHLSNTIFLPMLPNRGWLRNHGSRMTWLPPRSGSVSRHSSRHT